MRLKNLNQILEPDKQDGTWKNYLEPLDRTPAREESNLPSVDVVQVANNISELIPNSLGKLQYIINETPLIPGDEDYVPNAKLVLSAIQVTINAQIKVDENQLKARKQDDIMSVLSALKAEEKKQAALELVVQAEHELSE